ncbi:MAG TPA: hypothetical protein PKJ28_00435 [Bacteroidales bacterium]|nr:hypothetical protein [Bacteroidales bacterium]HPS73276.1 hypothetical protein [Bacteroidales bacterium]
MASSEKINIPQQPPMVMIDRLIKADEAETITALVVSADNVFVENGYLREPGLIENMAQTAAAGMGAKSSTPESKPRKGYIGALKNLKIDKLPAVGEEIITRVMVVNNVLNATIIEAEVTCHDEVIARGELKIFLEEKAPDPPETLAEQPDPLMYRYNREVFYSFNKETGFTQKVDYQYSANQQIIRQGWDAAEDRLDAVRQEIAAGILSPIAYHMERCLMELSILASYMKLSKWRIRRHLKPSGYHKLTPELRSKYAAVFGISVNELDNIDPMDQPQKGT